MFTVTTKRITKRSAFEPLSYEAVELLELEQFSFNSGHAAEVCFTAQCEAARKLIVPDRAVITIYVTLMGPDGTSSILSLEPANA